MKALQFAPSLLFALILITACNNDKSKDAGIIPLPNQIKKEIGQFTISNSTDIKSNSPEAKEELRFLVDALLKNHGISLASSNSVENSIIVTVDTSAKTGDEGYLLKISAKKIEVIAAKSPGIFYGIQTLIQLSQGLGQERIALNCLTIEDKPAYCWRGLMLDEARHFFGKEQVKKIIDQMAAIKMNRFHWHLVDDQGWRIEIKKYPKLTEIGAWRLNDDNKDWTYETVPAIDGKPKYGGFYTQQDIAEVVTYAAKRHITIIPEIEMPAHTMSSLYAYPELSCAGKIWRPDPIKIENPMFTYCAGNERVFEFLDDVITEVAALFPSTYIHIGGDECNKSAWLNCPKCKKRMKDEHLSNFDELQSYFAKRMEKILSSKGRTMIGWDEILEGGLAASATVMSWRGTIGGTEAASAGHDVVMSPVTHCYFDYYQGGYLAEPRAQGGYIPLQKVYQFNPMPDELAADKRHHILGGQCNLWTEYIFDSRHLEYMIFPRIFAMSEVLWTNQEKQDYADFVTRLPKYLQLLDTNGINFRHLSPEGLDQQVFTTNDSLVSISNPLASKGAVIYFTTDGSDPGSASEIYRNPIKITKTTCLKARLFYNGIFGSLSQSWFYKYDPKVNGLNALLFEGKWTNLPNFNTLKPVKTFVAPYISTKNPIGITDYFGLRLTAKYKIEKSGEYTFYLSSNEGSKLFIDGNLVVDYDGSHFEDIRTSSIQLNEGLHKIEIQYFESWGGEGIEVGTINNNGERIPLDAAKLFFAL